MTFRDRMQPAAEFESAVIERLQGAGWLAYPFGQAQLPPECRRRLSRFMDASRRPSLIRWMPDIITFCDRPDGSSFVALIDAKVCGGRPNYAIEMSAIEAAELYTDSFYTPTFFVFDDWKVLSPRDARQRGTPGPAPVQGNGSGTPYLLVGKRFGVSFHQVFAAAATSAAANDTWDERDVGARG